MSEETALQLARMVAVAFCACAWMAVAGWLAS